VSNRTVWTAARQTCEGGGLASFCEEPLKPAADRVARFARTLPLSCRLLSTFLCIGPPAQQPTNTKQFTSFSVGQKIRPGYSGRRASSASRARNDDDGGSVGGGRLLLPQVRSRFQCSTRVGEEKSKDHKKEQNSKRKIKNWEDQNTNKRRHRRRRRRHHGRRGNHPRRLHRDPPLPKS
jgi:hypothetical protein